MLIARAPVRISFAGGGTDLPAYFTRHGGAVVSATLDKYVYVVLTVHPKPELQILSSDYRTFHRQRAGEVLFWEGDLNLPKAILHEFGIVQGVSMFLASEVPPGTGLGSSSTVTVATVKAVSAASGRRMSSQEVAETATRIEIEKLGMPIGYQDQFAAAFGGLNHICFGADGRTQVEPIRTPPGTLERLQQNLLLFFTGQSRDSTSILARQRSSTEKHDPRVLEALHAVKAMVDPMRACLEAGDLDRFGELLHQGWQNKKRFASGVSNPRVDQLYELARSYGAIGGKLAGAGGGGFMMLYCADGTQEAVTGVLQAEGLRRMGFVFESGGARVLLNAGLRVPAEPERRNATGLPADRRDDPPGSLYTDESGLPPGAQRQSSGELAGRSAGGAQE
jgi:D-glycero-alpha-D-manno-heptose-7-phosphate kinase